ncbi:MAG: PhzF family phenazine biosynthesis protein [Pseudomonadota bacterium]|nr:PhzF family phenazine biosynthesis protein [Pseudomonadota bacterium]
MKIPIYQIDAFAESAFSGNPAAVCPLDDWLETETMQAIAEENNLSETAFFVPNNDDFDIRWFTPKAEIDLAGHPTLATAHAIFTEILPGRSSVKFNTKLGDILSVDDDAGVLTMDFPARPPIKTGGVEEMVDALGAKPVQFLAERDAFVVLSSESELRALSPDMVKLTALSYLGTIATAPGDEVDFVSRFFAPRYGIPEDPVTGSAHCELIPYWAERLGRTKMLARQISKRGGTIYCEYMGERVKIGGRALTFMRGEIEL